MTALTVTAADVSATEERGAIFDRYEAGEALTLGQAVYLNSSNKAYKAVNDSSAHAKAVGIVTGAPNFYGETTVASGDIATVCVYGPVWGFSSLSSGKDGWVGSTAGQLVDAAPTPNVYQFIVGHAIDDQTFFVDPGTGSPTSV